MRKRLVAVRGLLFVLVDIPDLVGFACGVLAWLAGSPEIWEPVQVRVVSAVALLAVSVVVWVAAGAGWARPSAAPAGADGGGGQGAVINFYGPTTIINLPPASPSTSL